MIACAALVAALLWATRRVATSRAVAQARQLGELDARVVFDPHLTDALLDGDAAAFHAFDEVATRYLAVGLAIRVKVWSEQERVVYSDEPRLVGRTFVLEAADRFVMQNGGTRADVTKLTDPENLFERGKGPLLEVYVAAQTPSGRHALIETYYPYHLVEDNARDIRNRFVPVMIAGLVILTLVQVPLATALSIRLRHNQRARERLLHRLVTSSDLERRRIAAEVHDGAVQDLIGLGYGLAGAATQASEPIAGKLRGLSAGLSATVHDLRTLLSSIYPVHVPSEGLPAAIEDLAEELRRTGVEVTVDLPERLRLGETDQVLILRATRELLRNVETHGHATTAQVRLTTGADRVILSVRDDGVGFDTSHLAERRQHGHLGLRLIADLATDAGGTFMIESNPQHGTVARLELSVTS
jgi:two-component system, NarL family, sensor kinase